MKWNETHHLGGSRIVEHGTEACFLVPLDLGFNPCLDYEQLFKTLHINGLMTEKGKSGNAQPETIDSGH